VYRAQLRAAATQGTEPAAQGTVLAGLRAHSPRPDERAAA
jgi:hypothetical protein